MTAKEIINKAIILLGYNDINGNTGDARLQSASLGAVNAVYSDLYYLNEKTGFETISDAEQVIDLDERTLNDVMPYGVASYIAQSIGDADNQQFFAIIYNQKRKTVTTKNSIQDTLPVVEG